MSTSRGRSTNKEILCAQIRRTQHKLSQLWFDLVERLFRFSSLTTPIRSYKSRAQTGRIPYAPAELDEEGSGSRSCLERGQVHGLPLETRLTTPAPHVTW